MLHRTIKYIFKCFRSVLSNMVATCGYLNVSSLKLNILKTSVPQWHWPLSGAQ